MPPPSGPTSTVPDTSSADSTAVAYGRTWTDHLARAVRRLGRVQVAAAVAMSATVAVGYAIILRTLDRGFDWTDEAFVYAMIASNRVAVGESWGFQHLLHPLYEAVGGSVLTFRVLRVVGYVLMSVALVGLARSVTRRLAIRVSPAGWVVVLLIAQIGTFMAWSYPPRYLAHNEIAAWLAQLITAGVALAMSWTVSLVPTRRGAPWALWAGFGGLLVLAGLTRVTTGIAMGLVVLVAFAVPSSRFRWWKRLGALVAGGCAVLGAAALSGFPLVDYLRNNLRLLDPAAQQEFGHPVGGLVSVYISSMAATVGVLTPVLTLFVLVCLALVRVSARRPGSSTGRPSPTTAAWVLAVLLLAALAVLPKANVWDYVGYLITFAGAAGLIALATAAPPVRAGMRRAPPLLVGGGAIVGAPFASAAGSTNAIAGQFLWAATIWAVLLGVALVVLVEQAAAARSSTRVIPAAVGVMTLLLATAAVYQSSVVPYRTAPLMSQSTPTSVPELGGMLLTADEAAWAEWIAGAGDRLDADDVPTVGISTPGGVYLFNGSGYANPWTDPMWAASFGAVTAACLAEPPTQLYVLQPGTATPDGPSYLGTAGGLAGCGIDFPGDFEVVDAYESANPALAMTIWSLSQSG